MAVPVPITATFRPMRLADFILANGESILEEWETFARTCSPAGGSMDVTALRDHAALMLKTIAADLAQPQSSSEQVEKSKGDAPPVEDEEQATAAEEHGAGRAKSGFTVVQMVAEYRALRASVVRLWTRHEGRLEREDIDDLTRFNEAIDQSLAESVASFNDDVEKAKETFLAILGHDLRTPLGAISTSAAFMLETGELQEPHLTLATRISASAKRTIAMVGDLLDFTRSHLGDGIPVTPAEVSLGRIVHDVVDEISAAHPGRRIMVEARGESRGQWDAARLAQAVTNLVGNAVQHGAEGTTVTVTVGGDEEEAVVAVHNRGNVIPADQLDGIFNPTRARSAPSKPTAAGPTGSLGLGLYIAERIVSAHGGRVEAESTEEQGTTFTVRLPRR
jgi:signal transduction histidine kinase